MNKTENKIPAPADPGETTLSTLTEAKAKTDAAQELAAIEAIELKVAEVLGQAGLDFIEKTLSKYVGLTYDKTEFSLVEKINLILGLAVKKQISLPPKLFNSVKNLKGIVPNGQLDSVFIARLNVVKRQKFIQAVSAFILLMGVSLGFGKVLITSSQAIENKLGLDAAVQPTEDKSPKALAAEAEFERLFSSDLNTVVDVTGWEEFLSQYANTGDQEVWPADEVFQAIKTQEPRYWGYYVVNYPEVFLEQVRASGVSLADFMSSCGTKVFFGALSNQVNDDVSWLDLWTMSEMFETLKLTNPRWYEVVVDNQKLFTSGFPRQDLPIFIRSMTARTENANTYQGFIDNYAPEWDQSWSRRELLDTFKSESELKWRGIVASKLGFFANDLTKEELTAVIEFIGQEAQQGHNYDSAVFSEYYSSGLYKILSPEEFKILIEQNFNQSVAENVLIKILQPNETEQREVQELFDNKAIFYVLENYDDWKTIYPAADIMKFLRENNKSAYYIDISAYPQPFQDEVFADDELEMLAYSDLPNSVNHGKHFFDHYTGESGWQNQFSINRVLKIGRNSWTSLSQMAIYFPEIFLPVFTDNDIIELVVYQSKALESWDVLNSSDPVWTPIATKQRRREVLDYYKMSQKTGWTEALASKYGFFEDVLTFEEVETILAVYPGSNLRTSQVWQSQMTPAAEYAFFKNNGEQALVDLIKNNPNQFSEQITYEDKLLVLKLEPEYVLADYHNWRQTFSPEFILEFFQSGKGQIDYGMLVIKNKQIFGHIFYNADFSLEESLIHGGYQSLFELNYQTDTPYIEDWLEIITLEEFFYMLKDFRDGRGVILSQPGRFIQFMQPTDIDLILQDTYGVANLLANQAGWSDLWSISDIYQAAKRNKAIGSAYYFFRVEEDSAANFKQLIEPDDLNFLVGSLPDSAAFSFPSILPILTEKWTYQEILTALQEEHPTSWGLFVTQESYYFKVLFSEKDLESLVVTGADARGLKEFGLWSSAELFDAYQRWQPEKWGVMVLSNIEVFMQIVVDRNISLEELLATTEGAYAYQFLPQWLAIWPDEIPALLEKYNPDNVSGG